MAMNMTKDYQLPMNRNPERKQCEVVTSETNYEQKITKESVDELIKVIDQLMNKSS